MTPVASRRALTALRVVVLVVGAVVMVTPFAYMLSTSFKPQAYVLTTPPQFIPDPFTFDNYVQAWTTQDFARYALNSFIVAVISTALSVLISSMMAYAFSRFDFPGREWIFRILLIGLIVPAMMLIIPQFVLAKYFGLLDSLAGLVVFYVAGSLALTRSCCAASSRPFRASSTTPCRWTARTRGPATGASRCRSRGRRSRPRRSRWFLDERRQALRDLRVSNCSPGSVFEGGRTPRAR